MFILRYFAFGAVMMVIVGFISLYTAATQRKLETTDITSIATRKPQSRWIRIEGGQWDITLARSSALVGMSTPLKVYLPLVKPDFKYDDDLIHVILVTEDIAIRTLYKEAKEASRSEEALEKFVLTNRERLRSVRTAEGLADAGINHGGSEFRELRESFANHLAEDFIVLEVGEKPSFQRALGLIGGGLVVLVACGFATRAPKKKLGPPPLPPVTPPPFPNPN